MTAGGPTLADRRVALRGQLQAQRQVFALQLWSGARDRYPRSATMRLLLNQPELVMRLVGRLAGARLAGSLYAAFIAIQALNSFVQTAPRGGRALPRPLNQGSTLKA